MKKPFSLKDVESYALIVIGALVMALNYEIFIFPNAFAPAGINGISTIIQHRFNFSVGYMSMIINVPLIIVAFFIVDRNFAVRTGIFVAIFSFATLILKNGKYDDYGFIDLNYYYNSEWSKLLAPVVSGIINGAVYGVTIRNNGCTGGTDVIASIFRIKKPYLNMLWVIFSLNSIVAVLSLFEFGDIDSVVLCLAYSFTTSKIGDIILKGGKSALKFEVVTSHPDEISDEIIAKLNHTATVVKAVGMFSHSEKSLLICVVGKSQIAEFEKIVKKYPETFTYLSSVNEIVGNFVATKNDFEHKLKK